MDLARSFTGTHFIYPSARKPRFVLPLNRRARRAGLSFFNPPTSRALLFIRWLCNIVSTFHQYVRLSETKVMEEIKSQGGHEELETVIKLGTPGPYTKNTVLLLDAHQVAVAIAKIGNTENATLLLKNEARWLKAISRRSYLAERCPTLFKEDQLGEVYFIIQSAGIGEFSDYGLSDSHIEFLSSFQTAFLEGESYHGSKMQRDLSRRFCSLKTKLSKAWVNRAEWALTTMDRELKGAHVTMAAAHRDFSPWNTRLTPRGLFVFDWEYASQGYLPLYDVFHFVLIPVALKSNISLAQVRSILRTVRTFGHRMEDGLKRIEAIELQLLAYLVDLSLMYLESRNGKDSGYVVLNRYAKLIDSFGHWETA